MVEEFVFFAEFQILWKERLEEYFVVDQIFQVVVQVEYFAEVRNLFLVKKVCLIKEARGPKHPQRTVC
jgi:hypothetical protein